MYSDVLAKIRNAERAKKEIVLTPFSKMDFAVVKILVQEGYVKDAQKKASGHGMIEIKLQKKPMINGFKIISKPSRRLYTDYRNLRPVKQNFGVAVISTPKGILSNKDARKNKVGGEYLFEIW